MTILLPYPSFEKSAEVFDRYFLSVQIRQCVELLIGQTSKQNAAMWEGCHEAVKHYHDVMVHKKIKRTYRSKHTEYEVGEIVMPKWFGWSIVHRSHRSFLLHRAYYYYKKFNWPEIPTDNLYFP